MSHLQHLLSLVIVSVSGLLFSMPAAAHSDHSSVFQLVFGENISHWLVSHQGAIGIVALLVFACLVHHVIARMKG